MQISENEFIDVVVGYNTCLDISARKIKELQDELNFARELSESKDKEINRLRTKLTEL